MKVGDSACSLTEEISELEKRHTISVGTIESESRGPTCCRGAAAWSLAVAEVRRALAVGGAGWEALRLSCELVGLDG